MNFYRHKCAWLFTIILVFILQKSNPQVITLPQDAGELDPTITLNEYYQIYTEVPQEPELEVNWFESPEDISRRIELNNIAHSTKYFSDGTPYLEKVVYGVPARMFLKEVKGYRYVVYDLKYVPFQDDPEVIAQEKKAAEEAQKKKDAEAEAESSSDSNVADTEQADESTVISEDTGNKGQADTEDVLNQESNESESALESSEESVGDGAIRTTAQENNEKILSIPVDTQEEDNPLKNSIVPSFQFRDTGKSLYVDVVIRNREDLSKREVLHRYAGEGKKIYTETYTYTDKGAIQRLNRKFENGAEQRYVYYFSTGGLKDVFYQDPDGSTYLLSYTIQGNLQSKILYNVHQALSYELHNTYNEKNELTSQIETDYENRKEIQATFNRTHVSERRIYALEFEGDEKKEIEEQETDDVGAVAVEEAVDVEVTGEQASDEQASDVKATDEEENDGESTSDALVAEQQLLQEASVASAKDSTNDDTATILETKKIVNRILLTTENFEYNSAGEQVRFEEKNILHEDVVVVTEENGLRKETNLRDSNIISEIIKSKENEMHIYYFKGKQILRIYYKGKRKIKEEVINNGEVIETRQGD